MAINFEYIIRSTPYRNSLSDVACSTLGGRVRAMMYDAKFSLKERYGVWKEEIQCATYLYGDVIF